MNCHPSELHIKDTAEYTASVSYLDILPEKDITANLNNKTLWEKLCFILAGLC